MTVAPLLLRVLLSVTLILNGGVGWAMPAGTSLTGAMDTSGVPDARTQATADNASEVPCHEAADGAAADAPAPSDQVDALFAVVVENDSADDCCGTLMCDCDCVHQSAVAIAPPECRAPDMHDPQPRMTFARARAAPMLAHLIRPPIG